MFAVFVPGFLKQRCCTSHAGLLFLQLSRRWYNSIYEIQGPLFLIVLPYDLIWFMDTKLQCPYAIRRRSGYDFNLFSGSAIYWVMKEQYNRKVFRIAGQRGNPENGLSTVFRGKAISGCGTVTNGLFGKTTRSRPGKICYYMKAPPPRTTIVSFFTLSVLKLTFSFFIIFKFRWI